MPEKLKVLSINFPFRAPWIEQEPTLATTRALFDFEVVVLRPYLIVSTSPAGKSSIESGDYNRARKKIHGKIEDINRLLQQDGLLVVILDALQELKFNTGAHTYTGGTIYTVTNYDFLDRYFFNCMRNGTGGRIEILDVAEPFSGVLKSSSVQWTAFIAETPPYPFADTSFFASNGAGSFVGGQISAGTGKHCLLAQLQRAQRRAVL